MSDDLVPTDPATSTTATPFFPTFAATSATTSSPASPVPRLTELPRRQLPRRLEIFNLDTDLDTNNDIGEVQLGTRPPARPRTPPTTAPSPRPTRPSRQRQRQTPRTTAESLFQTTFARSQPRQPAQPVEPVQPALAAALVTPTGSRQPTRVTPSQADQPEDPDYYYEYYYDYLQDDGDRTGHSADYDLVPLANKVRWPGG